MRARWLLVILAILFFAGLIYFTHVPDARLGPALNTKGGGLPGTGAGGTVQGDCCVCIADLDLDGSLDYCTNWLQQQTSCGVKKQVTLRSSSATCWQDAECGTDFLPNECKDKKLRIEYKGHSASYLCEPAADYTVNVCIKAGSTCGEMINNGCMTFQNYIDALLYISGQQAQYPNLKLSITGNQCLSYGGNICKTSASSCTISVDANASFCSFSKCNFGEQCAGSSEGFCGSALCQDSDGDIVNKVCCDAGSSKGKWTREEDCPSCKQQEGACCLYNSDSLSGSCFGVNKSSCYLWRGAFHFNSSCSSFQCPQLGACCLVNKKYGYSSCSMLTQAFCNAYNSSEQESVFHVGKTCAEVNNCQGACCVQTSYGSQYCQDTGSVLGCKGSGDSSTFISDKLCSQVTSCPTLNVSCCVLYKDGSTGCLDATTFNQCFDLKKNASVQSVDPSYSSCSARTCSSQYNFGACCKVNQFGIYSCSQTNVFGCSAGPNETVAWNQGKKCSEVNCKDSLMYGSCCTFLANGSQECYEHLTKVQCNALKNQSNPDKDIISTKWSANLTCTSSYCSPPKGACCKIDICGNGANSCQDDLTYQQCQEKKTACYNVQWSEGKKCSEIFCDKSGCRIKNPGAYTGSSCYQCKRNLGCSAYDILNGGCPSWCSDRDERGEYCCGPI